jgi:hypothetical protein
MTMKIKHGFTRVGKHAPEYAVWRSMKDRCFNANRSNYKRYGGRGITVCDRWMGYNGFINFISDMGRRPSPKHSLDRYPNNDGNYEPGNCRWATMKDQSNNRSSNVFKEHCGITRRMVEWAYFFKINVRTLRMFLRRHSFEEAYTFYTQTPKQREDYLKEIRIRACNSFKLKKKKQNDY